MSVNTTILSNPLTISAADEIIVEVAPIAPPPVNPIVVPILTTPEEDLGVLPRVSGVPLDSSPKPEKKGFFSNLSIPFSVTHKMDKDLSAKVEAIQAEVKDFKDMLTGVSQLTGLCVDDIQDETKSTIRTTARNAAAISSGAKKLIDQATSEVQSFSKEFRTLLSNLSNAVAVSQGVEILETIVNLIVTCVALVRAPNAEMRAYIGTMLVTGHHLLSKAIVNVDDLISVIGNAHWQITDSIAFAHAHGDVDTTELHESVLSMFTKLMAHLVTGDSTEMKADLRRSKALNTLATTFKHSKDFVGYLFRAVQFALETVYQFVTGIPYGFADEADLLVSANKVIQFYNNSINMPDLDAYILEKKALVESMNLLPHVEFVDESIAKTKNVNWISYTRARNWFITFFEKVKTIHSKGADRVRPVVVSLWGEPGTGKSNLRSLIVCDFAAKALGIEYGKNLIYDKKPNTNFWEKYCGQPICTMDDYNQLDVKEILNQEGMDVIWIGNDAPYPLNMAFVEKGDKFFSSKLLLCTGNKDLSSQMNIADKRALYRRWDFYIDVKLKPGLSTKDIEKMQDIRSDIYDLTLVDWFTNTSTPITYDNLITRMVHLYQQRNSKLSTFQNSLKKRSELLLTEEKIMQGVEGLNKFTKNGVTIVDGIEVKGVAMMKVGEGSNVTGQALVNFATVKQAMTLKADPFPSHFDGPYLKDCFSSHFYVPINKKMAFGLCLFKSSRSEADFLFNSFQNCVGLLRLEELYPVEHKDHYLMYIIQDLPSDNLVIPVTNQDYPDFKCYDFDEIIEHLPALAHGKSDDDETEDEDTTFLDDPVVASIPFIPPSDAKAAHALVDLAIPFLEPGSLSVSYLSDKQTDRCRSPEFDVWYKNRYREVTVILKNHLSTDVTLDMPQWQPGNLKVGQQPIASAPYLKVVLYDQQTGNICPNQHGFFTISGASRSVTIPAKSCKEFRFELRVNYSPHPRAHQPGMIIKLFDGSGRFVASSYMPFKKYLANNSRVRKPSEKLRVPIAHMFSFMRSTQPDPVVIETPYIQQPHHFNPVSIMLKEVPIIKSIRDNKALIIAAIIGAISIAGAGIMLYKMLSQDKPPVAEGDAYNVGTRPVYITNKSSIALAKANWTKAAAHVDPNAEDLSSVLSRNNGQLVLTSATGKAFRSACTFLCGRMFAIPTHVAIVLSREDIVLRNLTLQGVSYSLTHFETYDYPQHDLSIVVIGDRGFPEVRDITKHLLEEKDLPALLNSTVAMIKTTDSGKILIQNATEVARLKSVGYRLSATSTEYVFTSDVLQLQGANVVPQVGDCGFFYIAQNPTMQRKLVGMHVGGANRLAYCQILTQEMFADFKANIPVCQMAIISVPETVKQKKLSDPSLIMHPTQKSEIVPSLIHAQVYGEPSRYPAALKPRDGVSPFTNALLKTVRPDTTVPKEREPMLDQAVDLVFGGLPLVVHPQFFDIEDALNTPPGYHHIEPLHFSTSAGWPHNMQNKGEKGKRAFMTEEPIRMRKVSTPKLRTCMSQLVGSLLSADWKELEIVFADFLKDELRPKHKVESLSTRLVSAGTVEVLTLCRSLFSSFVENCIAGHNHSFMAVGTNPHSIEWRFLVDYLTKGDLTDILHFIAGDIEKLDASTSSQIHLKIIAKLVQWHSTESKDDMELLPGLVLSFEQRQLLRERILVLIFTNRVHVAFDTKYWMTHGNPSGNFLTTIINCLVTAIALTYCCLVHIILTLKLNMTAYEIWELIRMKIFGDDHEFQPFGILREHINMGVITHYMKDLGLVYVDFIKDSVDVIYKDGVITAAKPFYTLTETKFLKRGFSISTFGAVTAPLDEQVIKDTVSWCHNRLPIVTATQLSCQNALTEWFHYGADRYKSELETINHALAKAGLPPCPNQFQSEYARFHGIRISEDGSSVHFFSRDLVDLEPIAQMAVFEPEDKVALAFEENKPTTAFVVFDWEKEHALVYFTGCEPEHLDYFNNNQIPSHWKINADAFYTFTASNIEEIAILLNLINNFPVKMTKTDAEHLVSCDGYFNYKCMSNETYSFDEEANRIFSFIKCPRKNDLQAVSRMEQFVALNDDGSDSDQVWYEEEFQFVMYDPNAIAQMNADISGSLKSEASSTVDKPISSIAKNVSSIAYSLSSFPIIGSMASKVAPVTRAIASFAEMVGLDKPLTQEHVHINKLTLTSDLACVKGTDTTIPIGADPNNLVTNDPSVFIDKCDYNLFCNYKLLPGLILFQAFNSTYTQNQIICQIPVTPGYVASNFISGVYPLLPLVNLASMFRYWRGGIKYRMTFVCSKFISARVRIEWYPDPLAVANLTNTNVGDITSLTVDICGDTEACFTIPYLREHPYCVTADPVNANQSTYTDYYEGSNGVIVLRVVAPPVISNSVADTTIEVNIWSAGAEDIEFARPQALWFGYTYYTSAGNVPAAKNEPFAQMAEVQMPCRDMFKQTFKSLSPATYSRVTNVLQGESISSFTEYAHRYSNVNRVHLAAAPPAVVYDYQPFSEAFISSEVNAFYNRFVNFFLLHRGNMRYKIVDESASPNSMWTAYNLAVNTSIEAETIDPVLPLASGSTYQLGVIRPVIEVEIPFYGVYPFWCLSYVTEMNELPALGIQCFEVDAVARTHPISTLVAVGDNYSVGWPMTAGYISKNTGIKEEAFAQMDSGHGNEDRKIVQTEVQETQQLSSFRDTVGFSTDNGMAKVITPIHANADPYPDQGLHEVLSRQYLVSSIPWSGTDARSSRLLVGHYPDDLFAITSIADKIARFKYFQAGVHIEFRVNATTFHAGRLLIVWCPHIPASGNTVFGQSDIDMQSLSMLNSIELSAMSNQTVSIDIPYVAPSSFVNMTQVAPFQGAIGMFQVYVLNPLRLVGSTTTPVLTLTVYANFLQPKVAGPTLAPFVMSEYLKKYIEERDIAEKQASRNTKKIGCPVPSQKTEISKLSKNSVKLLGPKR